MRLTLQCLFSPRLYKIYNDGSRESVYKANTMERWGDKIISSAQTIYSIGLYTSPFIILYLYRRGMYTYDEAKSMGKIIGGISCILAFSILLRGVGRAYNPKYVEFLRTLNETSKDPKPYIHSVRKYDFDFASWPVSYVVSRTEQPDSKMPAAGGMETETVRSRVNEDLSPVSRAALQLLALVCTHTFALRLIYPGTLAIIQTMLGTALQQGRTQLVEEYRGQRGKVVTADGNAIDTMFVDRRGQSPRGDVLVICCEGNTGYYEVGIMSTAFRANYSALGWNHPGFGASTGTPFPAQEQNAVEAVVLYAVDELGFAVEQLVFFGWSIGGYSAAWAANRYPACRALVLDATFDELLPLAERQMPAWWSRLVREIVRVHVNLDVAALVATYRGPVMLVRRTLDEIITLTQGDLSTNRGNELALRLIEARHPATAAAHAHHLREHAALLATQRDALAKRGSADEEAARLINRYMRDFCSTHCTPLPEADFALIMRSLDPKQA